MNFNFYTFLSIIFMLVSGCNENLERKLEPETVKHGYVSKLLATKWEESMLSGNGTIGALVLGHPHNERIVYSHERLFLPLYPPSKAPNLKKILPEIRESLLQGNPEKATDLIEKAGEEVGIQDVIWTDPLIPASQLEIDNLDSSVVFDFRKSVNYETGETKVEWIDENDVFTRKTFASRADNVIVTKIESEKKQSINIRIRLARVPFEDHNSEEKEDDEDGEFSIERVLENEEYNIVENSIRYSMSFKNKWEGSVRAVETITELNFTDGDFYKDDEWLYIKGASKVITHSKINLTFQDKGKENLRSSSIKEDNYDQLLARHFRIHGEMFNRFGLELGGENKEYADHDLLYKNRLNENLDPRLVQQMVESSRYIMISSTGSLPPALQGIWGGTWLPNWSGDFTLNGNVPSAISSGMNTNYQEVIEAYMGYMLGFMDDFKQNARDLYDAPGIFIPSRSSSSGKTYHYSRDFPHLFWFTGNAWAAQFFYDYWQYSRDEASLNDVIIPFMLECMKFYEDILYQDEGGQYIFIPSYSPEVGPSGSHPLAINATMDVASIKQLIRNLLKLVDSGYISGDQADDWESILLNLPDYEVAENGDLKEWIWEGFDNDNSHRHASHLYPLYFETDPAFLNQELKDAASIAIEKRLQYRREDEGAEMAFGLVQLGISAAHIREKAQAYECVEWLCKSYWSPAFTSYHDPGEIFNTDICGGLPALVSEMIIQSSDSVIELLPSLPTEWKSGKINGVLTRAGIKVDMEWREAKVKKVVLKSKVNRKIKIRFGAVEKSIQVMAMEPFELTWSD